ncbi:YkgJ family cysteine cluster protein [Desulfosarcina sp. OttesenSCG-928-G17]|nr:YkgJ family cysteine cluster protein [Desulfosarcina sp. OttesenSCG-928-G17]
MSVDENHGGCRRCGVCCKKGGPALHMSDRHLVDDGRIPARFLFTLRRGERAHDNVRGVLAPLADELIKIKGTGKKWTCRFYDPDAQGCTIYEFRPLECRVLDCRNPREIMAVYETDRITRKDFLAGVPALLDLIKDHDRRCDYRRLNELMANGQTNGRFCDEAAILESVHYDIHLRALMVEKTGIDPEMLDFLLGRPLTVTLGPMGIKLSEKK